MKSLILKIELIFQFAWYHTLALEPSGLSLCSCYSFHGNITDFDIGRKICTAKGGGLVSMETLPEWEFINTQLQNKTTSSGHNQWWIGLERKAGVWQWTSGFNLTYNKWAKGLELNKKNHAVMEKNGGKFWNLYWYQKMGSICEYPGLACIGKQAKWCSIVTTTSQPTTVLRDTTKVPKNITPNPVNSPVQISTVAMTTNSTAEATNNSESAGKIKDKPFPVLILIIVIVAISLLCIGISIGIFICIKRRKKKRAEPTEHDEYVVLRPSQNHGGNTQDQPIDASKTAKEASEPSVYAEANYVKRANKQSQELNYVELTFTGDESQQTKQPQPYQPTEYTTFSLE